MTEQTDFHTLDIPGRTQRMNELYSMMDIGEKVKIIVPYFKSSKAIMSNSVWPLFTEASFLQYSKAWREQAGQNTTDLTCDFDSQAIFIFSDETWMNRSDDAKNFAIRHYFDVVSDIIFELTKK